MRTMRLSTSVLEIFSLGNLVQGISYEFLAWTPKLVALPFVLEGSELWARIMKVVYNVTVGLQGFRVRGPY